MEPLLKLSQTISRKGEQTRFHQPHKKRYWPSQRCNKANFVATRCKADVHFLLQEDTFNWLKQWYPLAAVEDLNPSKPFATKLVGECIGPVLI